MADICPQCEAHAGTVTYSCTVPGCLKLRFCGSACMMKHMGEHVKERDVMLEEAQAMVLRLVVVQYRQGWEDGTSEAEVRSRAMDWLANNGLDPHIPEDKERCQKVLAEYPGVRLDQCRSNQEQYKAAMSELKVAEKELSVLTDAAAELADLVDATVRGDYKPDTFTTQPVRTILGVPE